MEINFCYICHLKGVGDDGYHLNIYHTYEKKTENINIVSMTL